MNDKNYRRYMLGLLTLILAFNYVDRAVLSIVLQDVKEDLYLTDTQLGLLTGFAFALFYSVMGIPIARWADRGNRKTIIALTTTAWSAMVVFCGLAGNFLQLLAARIGVAIGEAGGMPPANSLIPDYFTREERPRAMSIYLLGSPLSLILGFFVGGWLNEIVGWRITFILLGAPGVGLGLLAWLTLKEPRYLKIKGCLKSNPQKVQTDEITPEIPISAVPISEVARNLWQNRTFRHLVMGFSIIGFFGAGISVWLPAFFIRSHGMETAELGIWMAFAWGVMGAAGLYLGGALASRFAANREGRQFQGAAIIMAMFPVIGIATYLTPSKYFALALMASTAFIISSVSSPIFAAIQGLVAERMRAQAIAVIFLFNSLIGLGLGPLAAGMLSDSLSTTFGEHSLRYTLVLLSPGYLWVAAHFWSASRTVEDDLAKASNTDASGEVEAIQTPSVDDSHCKAEPPALVL